MLRSEIIQGDVREVLAGMPEVSVQCVVTSPPYWNLRNYGVEGQLGLEATPGAYIESMVAVFREVRRVLRDDGTLWLNMGDSYGAQQGKGFNSQVRMDDANRNVGKLNPYGAKQLIGMPWRLALALQADGWWLRSDIIWAKPNPMPESCTDRPTKSHEYVFLLTKRSTYFWDAEAVRERREGTTHSRGIKRSPPIDSAGVGHKDWCAYMNRDDQLTSRNIRTVWTIPTQSYSEAHFATFPEKLVEPCIRAGTSEKGCCPECGAGWVRIVERERIATRPGASGKTVEAKAIVHPVHHAKHVGNRDPGRHVTETTTTGWRPGCGCNMAYPGLELSADDPAQVAFPPAPCTVLDPFAGSGTVGVVCARENRAFVGIELNGEYVKMAEERIGKAMRLADDERRQGVFEYGPDVH